MTTYNFNAGPSALPSEVLAQVQQELLDFEHSGMSIIEMSHRGAIYERVHAEAMQTLKTLLAIPDNYRILFMASGARAQFALLPMNFLPANTHADYLVTGVWSEQALSEGQKIGDVRCIWSGKETNYRFIPQAQDYQISPDARYLHYTSNNTVFGTQFQEVPPTQTPLVCDMSSDILSKPIDVSRFAAIYAGAQKNMGPAGVTVVIVRDDFLVSSPKTLPEIFSYQKFAENNSLLNTPPVFAIYMVGLVAKWLVKQGGLKAIQKINQAKAEMLYSTLDQHVDFYRPHAELNSRSQMNVLFYLANKELEKKFLTESEQQGFVGLKGHRISGGIRASLYNAVPLKNVEALVAFMNDFSVRNS